MMPAMWWVILLRSYSANHVIPTIQIIMVMTIVILIKTLTRRPNAPYFEEQGSAFLTRTEHERPGRLVELGKRRLERAGHQ